jgi:chromosome segregation ATPase
VANEPNDVLMRILQEVLDSRRVLGEGIDGVGGRLDSFRNDTLTNFDAAFRRLENVESELHAVSAALTRLEQSVEGDRARRELLRAEIQTVKERLAALERRLADLDGDSADPH